MRVAPRGRDSDVMRSGVLAPGWRVRRADISFDRIAALWWVLRVGGFLCFVGHGAFGIITKEGWLPFFALAGIGRDAAFRLMPIVGTVDVVVGLLVLLQPRAILIAYMVLWAVWTAALRPLTGQPVWEMFERAGNYGVPFALLLLCTRTRSWRSWVAPTGMRSLTPRVMHQVRWTLAVTTALLLVGHGALALQQKPELVAHLGLVLPGRGAFLSQVTGWSELGMAALILWRPTIRLCLWICGWKVLTESLYLLAGAPGWEVVERGGSYAAPLAFALLLWYELAHRAAMSPPRRSLTA